MNAALEQAIIGNKIDYDLLKSNSICVFRSNDELFDINVIIPVRGRINFAKPMFHYFSKAKNKSDLKINYVIVEYSDSPEHSKFCKINNIDYMFIQSKEGQMFNKCLAMNFSALFSRKSKYFIFHDLDCLMQSNFFVDLMKNVNDKNCRAIQTFTNRRVLYLDGLLTDGAIAGTLNIDILTEKSKGVSLPYYVGAPGGSIMIEKNLFFEIGGYEAEVFSGNAPEDTFFWDKVNTISNMEISNNPKIELFHMNHPPTYYSNPYLNDMRAYYNVFTNSSYEDKISFINLKKELIKKFNYEQ